jgi:hypothetical protein
MHPAIRFSSNTPETALAIFNSGWRTRIKRFATSDTAVNVPIERSQDKTLPATLHVRQ